MGGPIGAHGEPWGPMGGPWGAMGPNLANFHDFSILIFFENQSPRVFFKIGPHMGPFANPTIGIKSHGDYLILVFP